MRTSAFVVHDNGLASVAEMEAGSSGNPNHIFFNASKKMGSSSSPRFYEARCKELHHSHFLDACFLCKKPLGDNRDIFMYRGDTPFCSEECRQEQIEIDEAKEKNWNLSSSTMALRKDQKKSTQNYSVRSGTVAVA